MKIFNFEFDLMIPNITLQNMKTHLLYIFLLLIFPFGIVKAQLNNEADEIETDDGILTIHPVLHGSLVLEWNDKTIYVDPYGGSNLYKSFNAPDLILITHPHGDHLDTETLGNLDTKENMFIVPEAVSEAMNSEFNENLIIMANGESLEEMGISILAVPMYNLPEEDAG